MIISVLSLTLILILNDITAFADGAVDPIDFPVAPALKAIPAALKKAGLEAKDISRWEINEVRLSSTIRARKLPLFSLSLRAARLTRFSFCLIC